MRVQREKGMGRSHFCSEAALLVPTAYSSGHSAADRTGDTLFFATDGVRNDFSESLSAKENPQRRPTEFLSSIEVEMTMRLF